MLKYELFTDGACSGNPGPGGWGFILRGGDLPHEQFESGGELGTTNNRMELLGVIKALLSIKKRELPIHIYTDSKYVVESVEKKWLDNWIKTDFKGGKKNKDLWLQYHKIAGPFTIKFHWVKGHANNPFNNRCDELATQAADSGPWEIDTAFEAAQA